MEKTSINIKTYTIIIAVFAILCGYLLVKTSNEYERILQLKNEANYYSGEIEKLKKEKEEINTKQEKIGNDEIVESTARDKLNMVRPNERVYVIEE